MTTLAGALPVLLLRIFAAQFYFVADVPSYLVFHNVAEFFSVIVSLSIFGIAWNSHELSANRHTLFLGSIFLAIGLLDFMHALGYSGMPAFVTPNSPLKSTQYWIAARLFMALAFLLSAYVYPTGSPRWLAKPVLAVVNLGVPLLAFSAITFFPEYVPATYIEGVGLTPLKTYAEYLIIGLLAWTFVAYWRRLSNDGEQWLVYFLAAFILCIFSEWQFSSYQSVFDTYNVIGHLYKVASFCLIYWGVFLNSIKLPYAGMRQANERLDTELAENRRISEELKQHREHLEGLVAERTAQLEAANKELEAFAYSASHDLRAPLQTIDGFSRALQEDYGDKLDAEARDYLQRIRAATKHMGQLTDALLQFSRLARSDMALENLDLGAMARAVADQLRAQGPAREVVFDIAAGANAYADRRLLGAVLENLLGNAWKFTSRHPRARIEFGFAEREAERVYYVRDDGAGFDMDRAQKLFLPFQRLHTTTDFPGNGVGLALVKRIIQRHGGRIWAEAAPEKGAAFYFTLPGTPAKAPISVRERQHE